jgi:hypothetical protein
MSEVGEPFQQRAHDSSNDATDALLRINYLKLKGGSFYIYQCN